jgi:Replication-relaxation
MRAAEQILQVVGRHLFLTLEQRVDLLGTASKRLSYLERQLVERGWLRCIPSEELPEDAIGLTGIERRALRFVEITAAGRRQLAGWLGLVTPVASHYHGLTDNGVSQATRRARLLRTLPHTLGVNAVFVAFALAAEAVARQGGADELVEWRSAAACERRRCKPDGYGCDQRNGVAYGFLLEYDRGTEPSRRYAAKFGAYYRYRDSGEAARDFEGFPSLLFVTSDPLAEQRIAEQAYRAWFTRGAEPLPILLTTTEQIVAHREGILGPIWRTPARATSPGGAHRDYWLPGGPPRGVFGAGHEPVRTPRLVWPTAGEGRLSRGVS